MQCAYCDEYGMLEIFALHMLSVELLKERLIDVRKRVYFTRSFWLRS
jgi:hypothetical protein